MAVISLDEALACLNAGGGGWRFYSGRLARETVGPRVVTTVKVVDETIVFHSGNPEIARLSTEIGRVKNDRLTIEMTYYGDLPHRIAIRGPIMVKEQCKKADGGGWREIEKPGLHIALVHRAAEEQLLAERERQQKKEDERRRLAEQARREAERLAQELAAEAYKRRLTEYIARQKDRLRGATFEDLCIHGDSITIKFNGGLEVAVELHDREDPYDVHTDVSLGITIGNESP